MWGDFLMILSPITGTAAKCIPFEIRFLTLILYQQVWKLLCGSKPNLRCCLVKKVSPNGLSGVHFQIALNLVRKVLLLSSFKTLVDQFLLYDQYKHILYSACCHRFCFDPNSSYCNLAVLTWRIIVWNIQKVLNSKKVLEWSNKVTSLLVSM
jgi:hypothetical protein